jgi:hypothetical protein
VNFYRLQQVDRLPLRGVLSAQVSRQLLALWQHQRAAASLPIIERLETQPGVVPVAVTNAVPLISSQPGTTRFDIRRVRRPTAADHRHPRGERQMLGTIGIPLVARVQRARPGSDLPVAVINRSMARSWEGTDPVGSRVSANRGESWYTIVGVVGDVKQFGLATETVAQVYIPLTQTPQGFAGQVLMRTAGDPAGFGQLLRDTVHAVDPNQAVEAVQTLDDLRAEALASPRLTATLLLVFAGLALLVTLAGIGGVIATSVTQRTREFGVRMALGASRDSVMAMVLRQGLTLVVIGLAVGMGGALAAGHVCRALCTAAPRESDVFRGGSRGVRPGQGAGVPDSGPQGDDGRSARPARR